MLGPGQRAPAVLRLAAFAGGVIEGVVVRRESGGFTTARAKLVRAEFTRAIDEHWTRGSLRRNALAQGATPWH